MTSPVSNRFFFQFQLGKGSKKKKKKKMEISIRGEGVRNFFFDFPSLIPIMGENAIRTRNEVFFCSTFPSLGGGGGPKPKMEISIFFFFEPFP